ncbi:hypothetical protein TNCV_2442771 [Trichonephila clavipes]|nr:hypothetical protein TNCV_2442771 [Trichonephila clavipes]
MHWTQTPLSGGPQGLNFFRSQFFTNVWRSIARFGSCAIKSDIHSFIPLSGGKQLNALLRGDQSFRTSRKHDLPAHRPAAGGHLGGICDTTVSKMFSVDQYFALRKG